MNNTMLMALALIPGVQNILYTGTTQGVFKSTMGGESWTATNNGMNNTYVNALAINPRVQNILYTGTTQGVFRAPMVERAGLA